MEELIKIDPEFKSLIPPLSPDEYEQLRLNLIQDGCRDAICVWGEEGDDCIIIDGHNRFEICNKYGIDYSVEYFKFSQRDEAKQWIILNQFGRRNLSNYQRSVLALELEGLFRVKAKEKQHEGINQYSLKQKSAEAPIETRKELAKIAGVSHDTISKVKVIQEKAPEDVKAKLASGDISINEAFLDIKKEEKKENDQNKFIELKSVELPLVNEYGENMFVKPNEFTDKGFGDEYIVNDYNKIRTVTTLCKFFHSNGHEFSLREYSDVQDFPKDYKFIGSYSEIKKQIGNAVNPLMGKYISADIDAKTCGDLFAGCGGFSVGLSMNGIRSIWAIEWENVIAMTYKLNHPETEVYQSNIKHFDPSLLSSVDVIVGGPPCQGFSRAKGYSFIDDPRNELYKEFVRFIKILKPRYFIMENVQEIQQIKDDIINDFQSIGYAVQTELVNGNDIGLRQMRKRFFFKGRLL